MPSIDHIEYEGSVYDFADTEARKKASEISTELVSRLDKLSDKLDDEIRRASSAELGLEQSKLSAVPGKGLSTNDLTDELKAAIEANSQPMQGCDEYADGEAGYAPKPHAGDQDKFLAGDGTWKAAHDTTYDVVSVQDQYNGLMPFTDKEKLDKIDNYLDDTKTRDITIGLDSVVTVYPNDNKSKTITFNNDGSLTEVRREGSLVVATLTTTFSEGHIHVERS